MNLVEAAGKVSHLNRISTTSGGGGGSAVDTSFVTTFRVDGRQYQINGACHWMDNNDYVAIVGRDSGGVLVPLAIRNDTSGYENIAEPASLKAAILWIVFGVLLIALMVGIFMIAWGIWSVISINQDKKYIAEAERRLRNIPQMTTPGT